MIELTQSIIATITQWLEQGNPLVFGALFLIAGIIEQGIPIPFVQDAVLLFIGFNPQGNLWPSAPFVMLSLATGRIFSASIVFWISRRFSFKIIGWLGKRFPKLLKKSQNLESRLSRGPLAVTLARLTPGLGTPSSIAAGLFKVKYIYLIIGIVISSVVTDGGEIAAGIAIRAGFTVAGFTPTPMWFTIVFLCFMILLWTISRLWRKLKARKSFSAGING
jgi:membrane protein DedA with SNARE-associated domain